MTPLEELLDTLDGATGPDDPPFLVAAFGAAGQGGVLVTDGESSHLLGWRVPPECWAVGFVGGCSPIPQDGSHDEQTPLGQGSMRLCCLVGRDGTVATLLRSPSGDVIASGEAEGRIVDALRRALDLPTPPAAQGTEDLLAILWIEDLLAAADGGVALGWPAAAGLHPAMRVLAAEGHDIDLEHVTMIARVATAAWSWENLRIQAYQEDWLGHLVTKELAEWMDVGMFARWILADVPALDAVSSAVEGVLDPSVWREVKAVIAATGAGQDDDVGARWARTQRDGCRRRATPEPAPRPRATRHS